MLAPQPASPDWPAFSLSPCVQRQSAQPPTATAPTVASPSSPPISTRGQARTPLPHLPLEIKLRIANHLAAAHASKTLASMLPTSKEHYNAFRPILFRDVALTTKNARAFFSSFLGITSLAGAEAIDDQKGCLRRVGGRGLIDSAAYHVDVNGSWSLTTPGSSMRLSSANMSLGRAVADDQDGTVGDIEQSGLHSAEEYLINDGTLSQATGRRQLRATPAGGLATHHSSQLPLQDPASPSPPPWPPLPSHIRTLRIVSLPPYSLCVELAILATASKRRTGSELPTPGLTIECLVLGFGIVRQLADWVDLHQAEPSDGSPRRCEMHPFVKALAGLFSPKHVCVDYGSRFTREVYVRERLKKIMIEEAEYREEFEAALETEAGAVTQPGPYGAGLPGPNGESPAYDLYNYGDTAENLKRRWDRFYVSSNTTIIDYLTSKWRDVQSLTVHNLRHQGLPTVHNDLAMSNCTHRYIYAKRGSVASSSGTDVQSVHLDAACKLARGVLSRKGQVPEWEFVNIEGWDGTRDRARDRGHIGTHTSTPGDGSTGAGGGDELDRREVARQRVEEVIFGDPTAGIRGKNLTVARGRTKFTSKEEAEVCVCCGRV